MIKVSAQHKAEQIQMAFPDFKITMSQKSLGSGHAAARGWCASIGAIETWDSSYAEWSTAPACTATDASPSKAIAGLWKSLSGIGIHRKNDGEAVWQFNANVQRFLQLEPGTPGYPETKDISYLATMEWPPTNWKMSLYSQYYKSDHDNEWVINKSDQYVKVQGKKIKCKQLKIFIHELSLYYENDVKPEGEMCLLAKDLSQHGIYYLTEEQKAAEAKKVADLKASLEAKKKKSIASTATMTNVTTSIQNLDATIQNQMIKWGQAT